MPGVDGVGRRRDDVEPGDREGYRHRDGDGEADRHDGPRGGRRSYDRGGHDQAKQRDGCGATRGREDHHGRRPWRGHGRGDAHESRLARAGAEAIYPDESERTDQSRYVPITRRPRQPVTRDVPRDREQIGQEPRRHRGDADPDAHGGQAEEQDAGARGRAANAPDQHEHHRVQKGSVVLEHGASGRARPRTRHQRPDGECDERRGDHRDAATQSRDRGPRQHHPRAEDHEHANGGNADRIWKESARCRGQPQEEPGRHEEDADHGDPPDSVDIDPPDSVDIRTRYRGRDGSRLRSRHGAGSVNPPDTSQQLRPANYNTDWGDGLSRTQVIVFRPGRTACLVLSCWALGLTCVGTGLLLAFPGTAWAISGYANGSTAVAAQYPDSTAAQGAGPKPAISDLAQVMQATQLSDPPKVQANRRKVLREEVQALSSGEGNLRQTGSIALLIAAIAVVLVGGVLRWRRVDEKTE